MKKYFLHNGTEQLGPFSIEELKGKNVSKETPVWFEGLDKWKIMDEIEELKDIFVMKTPPPFNPQKVTPPPIKKLTARPDTTQATPKKNFKTGRWVILILILIFVIGGGLMIFNNPNSIPGVKLEINTPKPMVVTSRADASKSTLLKGKTTVFATVQNQGGDGNILVKFHVYQDGNHFNRSQEVYLRANSSEDVEMTFDEVRRLGGKITYNVEAN